MIKTIVLLTILFYSSVSATDESKNELEKRSNEIKEIIIQAKSNNALWRDTQNIYESAKQLIISKDYHQANLLLDEVLYQLHTAQEQAMHQNTDIIIPSYLRR